MIVRPLMLLALFVVAAQAGWWWIAIASTYFLYSSILTAVHHFVHTSLGLSPRARRFWLRTIAGLVAESGHALQTTHLLHHRGGADLPDPEGYIENVGWRQLPLETLRYRYRLMWWGWRYGPHRHRVAVDFALHVGMHLVAVALAPITIVPLVYFATVRVISIGFAAFIGKGPQTNWGRRVTSPFVKVTTRFGWIPLFSHDRHLEHHIYPKVPMPYLSRLRYRLDPILDDLDVVDVKMSL